MRVLVIEDDRETAQFLQRSLRESGHAADIAGDGETGLVMARDDKYDVLIVDRMLPRRDGLSVVQTLRGEGAHTPVLILSALGEVDDRVKGLRAGGDDYLTKPYAYSELLARIEALGRRFRRDSPTPVPEQVEIDQCLLDLGRCTATREGQTVPLTAREVRILRLLYQNRVRAMTRGELLEKAWGASSNLQTRTVDMTIANLRQKIERDPGVPQIVSTVKGVGYAWGAR